MSGVLTDEAPDAWSTWAKPHGGNWPQYRLCKRVPKEYIRVHGATSGYMESAGSAASQRCIGLQTGEYQDMLESVGVL